MIDDRVEGKAASTEVSHRSTSASSRPSGPREPRAFGASASCLRPAFLDEAWPPGFFIESLFDVRHAEASREIPIRTLSSLPVTAPNEAFRQSCNVAGVGAPHIDKDQIRPPCSLALFQPGFTRWNPLGGLFAALSRQSTQATFDGGMPTSGAACIQTTPIPAGSGRASAIISGSRRYVRTGRP